MTDGERRDVLVQSVERHEAELQRALTDFKMAVERPFAMANEIRDRISAHPLPWILSSVLLGFWLATRNGHHDGN